MTTAFKSTPEWRVGKFGEDHVKAWGKRNGFILIPTTDIEMGGAPRAISALEHDPVLPDYIAARQGEHRLLEVKTKDHAPFFRNFNRHQHGIALRLWDDYKTVGAAFGFVGYLAIVELHREPPKDRPQNCGCLPILLMGRFDLIAKQMDRNSSPGVIAQYGEPMAFFDHGKFERLSLTENGPVLPSSFVLPPKPTASYVVHPWEERRRSPGLNEPQQGVLL